MDADRGFERLPGTGAPTVQSRPGVREPGDGSPRDIFSPGGGRDRGAPETGGDPPGSGGPGADLHPAVSVVAWGRPPGPGGGGRGGWRGGRGGWWPGCKPARS